MLNKKRVKKIDDLLPNLVSDRFIYMQEKKNPNNMSSWIGELYQCGVKLPETFILKLTLPEYRVLNKVIETETDKEQESECIHALAEKIIFKMEENKFNILQNLVIKKSFKSDVDLLDEYIFIGEDNEDTELFYDKLVSALTEMVQTDKGMINEIVIQGYIEAENRPYIQNNIALNTRVRAYYSFDTNETLEFINCWDSIRVKQGLKQKNQASEQMLLDIAKLEGVIPKMNKDIQMHYYYLKAYLEDRFKDVMLYGVWVIDILVMERGYYVVEMKQERVTK